LNKTIEKRIMALFVYAKTSRPKWTIGASTPLSLLTAHQPIPAITGDEVEQGVAGEEA
jgi:hypothetical protein